MREEVIIASITSPSGFKVECNFTIGELVKMCEDQIEDKLLDKTCECQQLLESGYSSCCCDSVWDDGYNLKVEII